MHFESKSTFNAITMAALFLCLQPTQAAIESGLVLHYSFDGNAHDSSGHGNNGSVVGATLVKGLGGDRHSAYLFDGTDTDIIAAFDNPSLDPGKISVCAWVKFADPAGWGRIVDKYRYVAQQGYNLIYNFQTSTVRFEFWGVDGLAHNIDTVSTISPGEWHFYAATYDGTMLSIYHDGALEGQSTPQVDIQQSDRYLSIGNGFDDSYDWPLSGTVDEVRVYKRALKPAEVEFLYQLDKP